MRKPDQNADYDEEVAKLEEEELKQDDESSLKEGLGELHIDDEMEEIRGQKTSIAVKRGIYEFSVHSENPL